LSHNIDGITLNFDVSKLYDQVKDMDFRQWNAYITNYVKKEEMSQIRKSRRLSLVLNNNNNFLTNVNNDEQ